MHSLAGGSERIWRQLAASLLIIAILLQGMTFAVAGARLVANAGSDTDWAGYELCHHDGGNAALPGSAPENPATDKHCVFCLAGAAYILGAPAHTPEFHTIVLAIAPWKLAAWRLSVLTLNAGARPRGPPPAA